MNSRTYAADLAKKQGLHDALRISERLVKGTSSSNWADLPRSSVFNVVDKNRSEKLDTKGLMKTHSFWLEVRAELRKRLAK